MRIKEPTYSEKETFIFKGASLVVNNIYNQKDLFETRDYNDYSRMFGFITYLIAGWWKTGDADLAGNIGCRFGKRVETYTTTRYAVKMIKVVNDGYRLARKITESAMKETKVVDVLLIEQSKALISACHLKSDEDIIKYVYFNLKFFIESYLEDEMENKRELPILDENWIHSNDDIINPKMCVECALIDSEIVPEKNKGVIRSFYSDFNKEYGGFFSFHYYIRVPLGYIYDMVYAAIIFREDIILGMVVAGIVIFDMFITYCVMARKKHSYLILNCQFIFSVLLGINRYISATDKSSIGMGGIFWSLYGIFYFWKRRSFFNKEIYYNKEVTVGSQLDNNADLMVQTRTNDANAELYSIVTNNERMGFCRKCGVPLIDGAKYCNKCGTQIDSEYNNSIIKNEEIEDKSKIESDNVELLDENKSSKRIEKADVEEIRRWKDLLDDGIITQEEFDKKKKDVLKL